MLPKFKGRLQPCCKRPQWPFHAKWRVLWAATLMVMKMYSDVGVFNVYLMNEEALEREVLTS